MARSAPFSHSARPWHRAQSLERKAERWRGKGGWGWQGQKMDGPAGENEKEEGIEQTGWRRKIAQEACY